MWQFQKVLRKTAIFMVKRWKSSNTQKKLSSEIFAAQYCINLVEQNDYENYLCTLLLKSEYRRHAFALRAFNVEIAKSSGNASEDVIAKMRLKFWYDSVDKCFDENQSYVADHPVLQELRNTVNCNQLNKIHLKRLVTARDRTRNQQFATINELEDYAEQAFSSLIYLLVQLSGVKNMMIDHAASHLGKALGITTLLRAIPYKGRNEALIIPQETLIKHGVSQERIMRHNNQDKGVEDCIFEVATVAHQHLEKSRSLADNVPKEIRPVFLPAVAVQRYLERLRKANFRLTDNSCLQRDSMLPMSVYWFNLRRKF